MNQLDIILEKVIGIATNPTLVASLKSEHIRISIHNHATELLNTYKAIETTSVDEEEKQQRLEAMAAEYDITIINEKFY